MHANINLPDKLERQAICRRVAADGGELNYGVGDAIGPEGTYDTFDVTMNDLRDESHGALYAIFDGRNGSATSSYCQRWVPYKLVTELGNVNVPENALRRTFISVNKDHGLALGKGAFCQLFRFAADISNR